MFIFNRQPPTKEPVTEISQEAHAMLDVKDSTPPTPELISPTTLSSSTAETSNLISDRVFILLPYINHTICNVLTI